MLTQDLFHPAATGDMGYRLAFHCAPAIAGVKPANLVSLKKGEMENYTTYVRCLYPRGVFLYKLLEQGERVLLLVYNKNVLAARLQERKISYYLQSLGYDTATPLYLALRRLRERIGQHGGEYPHEIGVFLGYPLEDVEGFIRNCGNGFKLCGYWKVYGDRDYARSLFRKYDLVRGYFCAKVRAGEEIHNIQYGGIA